MSIKNIKRSVKNILRGTDHLLFSDTLAFLGFLANLGIVTLTCIILYLSLFYLNYVFSFESMSFLRILSIFSITYWALMGIIYKTAIGKNEHFTVGFLLSAIFITLVILATYVGTIF